MSTPSALSCWFLPLALALGAAPLKAAESPGPTSPTPQASGDQSDAALKLAAIEFLTAGDYAAAQRILDKLTVRDILVKAAQSIAAGQGREALQPLDRALKIQPANANLLAMRGEAAYAAAAGDSQPGFFYDEAMGFFRDAVNAGVKANGSFGPDQLALILRASQAARRVPKPGVALEYATIAAAQHAKLLGQGVVFSRFEVSLHQIWAEAAFDNYREAKTGEDTEASARLFLETEDQLERTLGERPSETWALEQLSNLYLWEARQDDARSALERAVEINPGNAAIQEKAFRMVWDQSGADEAVNYATHLRTSWPESPFGYWYGGSAEFYRALTAFLAAESVRDVEAFQRAEAFFARCRELEPTYAQSSLNYEVTCRAAVGWCYYNEDKKEEARDAFLSTGELFEGGLSVTIDNRLPNGLAGLTYVAAKFAADPRSVEGQDQAASIAWTVFQVSQDDPNLANNAGFFNRDAAVLHHSWAAHMHDTAAANENADEAKEQLAFAATQDKLAMAGMQRSWEAYARAAELAPDDVRIVNDAGLIMTYYLRTDAKLAEELLLQSVAAGETQRADSDPMSDLNEAWGDAHQNLAVLYLTWLDEPAKAKQYMQKALEIGPGSRNRLRGIMDVCDERIAGKIKDSGQFDRMIWTPSASH